MSVCTEILCFISETSDFDLLFVLVSVAKCPGVLGERGPGSIRWALGCFKRAPSWAFTLWLFLVGQRVNTACFKKNQLTSGSTWQHSPQAISGAKAEEVEMKRWVNLTSWEGLALASGSNPTGRDSPLLWPSHRLTLCHQGQQCPEEIGAMATVHSRGLPRVTLRIQKGLLTSKVS